MLRQFDRARSTRAVYPGTFDPFTDGHRDLVDRARRLFAHVTVLVAVNEAKRPSKPAEERARDIRVALPSSWEDDLGPRSRDQ